MFLDKIYNEMVDRWNIYLWGAKRQKSDKILNLRILYPHDVPLFSWILLSQHPVLVRLLCNILTDLWHINSASFL